MPLVLRAASLAGTRIFAPDCPVAAIVRLPGLLPPAPQPSRALRRSAPSAPALALAPLEAGDV